LNTKPKHAASTTLAKPQRADTTVFSGDVAGAVRELRANPGRELQVHGCGALVRWLLDNGLVDEINLFSFPADIDPGVPAPRAPAIREATHVAYVPRSRLRSRETTASRGTEDDRGM
jgi:dihydrofolate reductase